MVTVVFAVFVFTLLLALLIVGKVSDYVGRRPVVIVALLVEAMSMVVFIAADGVGWLLAARAVQGLATGAAIGPLSAALVDLRPARRQGLGELVASTAPPIGNGSGRWERGCSWNTVPPPPPCGVV
ncbi:MFS transporter, partial [Streptomyces noursei]|nr:MFS transporter [Streptomyces noursei]